MDDDEAPTADERIDAIQSIVTQLAAAFWTPEATLDMAEEDSMVAYGEAEYGPGTVQATLSEGALRHRATLLRAAAELSFRLRELAPRPESRT